MKKLILVVMTIILSVNVNTVNAIEVSDTLVQNQSKLTSMSPEVANNIKEFLGLVGGRLESGVAKGYDIFVQQQKVYAYQYLSILILGIILTILAFIYFVKAVNKLNENKNSIYVSFGIFFAIFGVTMCIIGFCHYSIIVQGIFNPDYSAIKEIIELVKQNVK